MPRKRKDRTKPPKGIKPLGNHVTGPAVAALKTKRVKRTALMKRSAKSADEQPAQDRRVELIWQIRDRRLRGESYVDIARHLKLSVDSIIETLKDAYGRLIAELSETADLHRQLGNDRCDH